MKKTNWNRRNLSAQKKNNNALVLTSSNQGIAKSHKDYIPKMDTCFCQKDEKSSMLVVPRDGKNVEQKDL